MMVVFTVGLTTAAIWPQGSDQTVITVIMMIIISLAINIAAVLQQGFISYSTVITMIMMILVAWPLMYCNCSLATGFRPYSHKTEILVVVIHLAPTMAAVWQQGQIRQSLQ
jgi:ABC-type polysaccharide/polyol phosphate export permease